FHVGVKYLPNQVCFKPFDHHISRWKLQQTKHQKRVRRWIVKTTQIHLKKLNPKRRKNVNGRWGQWKWNQRTRQREKDLSFHLFQEKN
ncbi:hypothetical protein DKP78_14825, partial [Enterococcus faecium]